MNLKNFYNLKSVFLILALAFLSSSCSKDDKDPVENPFQQIDLATAAKKVAGTYKGTLDYYDRNNNSVRVYDAIIIATDAGNNQVRFTLKEGEKYSYLTPKTITIREGATNKGIGGWSAGAGDFEWNLDANSVEILDVDTFESSETDVIFYFQGVRVN